MNIREQDENGKNEKDEKDDKKGEKKEKSGKNEKDEQNEQDEKENSQRSLNQVRLLVAGAADSGKSTLIGVLKYNKLDTHDNPIALEVDLYKHERESGKTSSISTHYMTRNKGEKVIELINLCGQQKYLKNTLYGMSGMYADYGILLVNINKGLTDMGIEHLNIMVHLNIPFFIVITKMDLCKTEAMYLAIHKQLHKELKKSQRTAASLRVDKSYNLTENYTPYLDFMQQRSDVVPIICISNRTGQNMDILRDFLFGLRSRPLWMEKDIKNNVFFITAVYLVKHVGVVLSGVVKSAKSIKLADEWFVGPYMGQFLPVKIKSIHNDIRQDVDELSNGESGCVCIRFTDKDNTLTRSQFMKGMILTDTPEKASENVANEFKARVMILQHHTSVKSNFQSVIHLGPIRQTAKIVCKESEYLRTGDVSVVNFRWMFRPEYMEPGTRFFGREGSCRFCGEVLSVVRES